jgi:L-fuculose-phosphate aldolase
MSRIGGQASHVDLRDAIVDVGRICYERKLMTANDGNISARLDANHILITRAGVAKGRLHSDDLLVVSLKQDSALSDVDPRPSSETPMHLEVYKQRADAGAVIHSHPVFSTALTVAGLPFPGDILPETLLLLGEVPITAYAMPSTAEDAEAVRPYVRDHSAFLLPQHGALTIGIDLEEALQNLERLEHTAEVFWHARALGDVKHLPAELRERLRAVRDGLPRPRS